MGWKALAFKSLNCRGSVPIECLGEQANEIECFIRTHGTRPYYVEHYNGYSVDNKFTVEECMRHLKELRKGDVNRYKEDPNLYMP